MTVPHFDEHVLKLRENYIVATPRQRYSTARKRIANPEHEPNVLVAYVSAIEGLARSLSMHRVASSARELVAIYPKYKWDGPEQLITGYLQDIGLPGPAEFFGADTWENFRFAVEYRNVLVHECTYIGSDRSVVLIASSHEVLHKLAAAGGLQVIDA